MLEVEPRRSVEPNARSERPLPRNTRPWVDALALAEGGLLADVAVLLELVRVFLPVVGIVFAPLVPTPFALLVLRRGSRSTLLAVAVGVLLVSLIAGPHYGWRMGVSGLVGLALGFAMKARLRPAVIVAVGTLLTSLALYGFFFASIWLLALPLKDIVAEMQNLLHTANSATAFLAEHLGLDTVWQHLAPVVLAVEDWMIAYWPLVLYGVILGVSLGTVVLYYAVANRFVRLLGFAVRPFPSPRFAQGIQKVGRLAQRVWLRPKRQQTAVGAAASVGELKPVDQHEPVDSRC